MKILSIGNSFSVDAHEYLCRIAKAAGVELYAVNLYIGGCSLEMHANNLKADAKAYKRSINAVFDDARVAIKESLLSEKWDVVTIQQVSQLSGVADSYEPYAAELLAAIRAYAPQAKICFYQTWAYEIDSDHGGFVNYNRSQSKMFQMITEASEAFCEKNGLTLIPSGRVVEALRHTEAFDYANGGKSLCRDGFHMSYDYGRYAAGATWFQTLTGVPASKSTFAPEGTEQTLIDLIKATVQKVCAK